jgi:hypothetical protein
MKEFKFEIKGQQKHISNYNNSFEGMSESTLISWIERVRGDQNEEDYPVEIPQEVGEETYQELSSDYYITIERTK